MTMVRHDISSSLEKTLPGGHARPQDTRIVREGLTGMVNRLIYGTAWAMKSERAWVLPFVWWAAIKHELTPYPLRKLPDPARALNFGEGLAGVYDRLNPKAVLEGYARGLYAFAHVGPMKWWSPPKRSVLFFEQTHLEKNLRRLLRQNKYRVTFDQDFASVIRACSEPRPDRYHLTWIRPAVIDCFTRLHRMGHAHSVEVWDKDGNLVGGLYGLAMGRVFFTESQFFKARDASKVGFAVLNQHLQHWGFAMNDGKLETPHLRQTGFTDIPRAQFETILGEFAATPFAVGPWSVDEGLDVATWIPSEADSVKLPAALAEAA